MADTGKCIRSSLLNSNQKAREMAFDWMKVNAWHHFLLIRAFFYGHRDQRTEVKRTTLFRVKSEVYDPSGSYLTLLVHFYNTHHPSHNAHDSAQGHWAKTVILGCIPMIPMDYVCHPETFKRYDYHSRPKSLFRKFEKKNDAKA